MEGHEAPHIELQQHLKHLTEEHGLPFSEVGKMLGVLVLWLLPFYKESEIDMIYGHALVQAQEFFPQVFTKDGWVPADEWRPKFEAGDVLAVPPGISPSAGMLEAALAQAEIDLEGELEKLQKEQK